MPQALVPASTLFGMVAIPVPGPEVFLLSPDDPLRAAHLRLNDYLLAEEQRDNARTPFDVPYGESCPNVSWSIKSRRSCYGSSGSINMIVSSKALTLHESA